MSPLVTANLRHTLLRAAIWAVLVLVLLGAALFMIRGGSGSDVDSSASASAGRTTGAVTVDEAWVSVSLDVGAGYVTIENDGDPDRLTAVASPAAETVSLMDEEHGPGGHDGADLADIEVPSGSTRLEPGVAHIMLEDLSEPLEPGDTISLELTFEQAGSVTVEADVLDWEDVVERMDS